VQHLKDVSPKLAECNRCHAYVFAGMQSGCRYAVDTTPLNSATLRALNLTGIHAWKIKGNHFNSHGCGCSALDASAFEEREIPPLQAPATPERDVFEGQGLTCSVVSDVRPHRSDVVRCAECGVLMDVDEPRFMVEIPVWQEDNVIKVRGVPGRKGYTKDHPPGWGHERWAIHPDGCPVSTTTSATSAR
jgi:hypothetical protein